MNIDTTKTTAIFSSSSMASAASATQAKLFSGNSTSSFESEIKASKAEDTEGTSDAQEAESSEKASDLKRAEKKENKKSEDKVTKEQSKDDTQTLNGEVTAYGNETDQNNRQNSQNQNAYSALSEQVQAYINANGGQFNFASVNAMAATSRNQLTGMAATVDYSSVQMSDADAKFFADLVSKTDMSVGSIAAEFQKSLQQGNVKMVQSTAKASAALIEALKESSNTHQPFRIDFDRDISVILQVDKAGKINANFIPGDKAVENYLRNNIDFLRQRFNEENIAYGDINYSKSRRQKEEQQGRNSKEGGNE